MTIELDLKDIVPKLMNAEINIKAVVPTLQDIELNLKDIQLNLEDIDDKQILCLKRQILTDNSTCADYTSLAYNIRTAVEMVEKNIMPTENATMPRQDKWASFFRTDVEADHVCLHGNRIRKV
jgi:hypothetical protein